MKRAVAVLAVLVAGAILGTGGVTIYRSQHMMSHDVLVRGRLALQSLERAHELTGLAHDLENDRGAKLFHEVEANRANDSDKRAVTFLQNYATATGYVETFPNDAGFSPHLSKLTGVTASETLLLWTV